MKIHAFRPRYWCLGLSLLVPAMAVVADHPMIGLQGGPGGPITTATARTLPKGAATVSLEFQYIDFDPVSDARLALASRQGEDIHSADALARSALNLAFGVSDKLTLGLSLPYVERKGLRSSVHGHESEHEEEGSDIAHDHDLPEAALQMVNEFEGVAHLGDATGFGDARLYGSYRLTTPENGGATALLSGVKAPTGLTHEKNRQGKRLEAELQPGSGSWDPFLGVAHSRRWGAWSLDGNLLYTLVMEGSQDTDLGDILNYNFSLSRSILGSGDDGHAGHSHDSFPGQSGLNVSLILEVNGEWRDRVAIGGHDERHSGGNLVYLSPGLSISTGGWTMSTAISLPLENLNGLQSEPETRLVFRLARMI